MKRRWRAYNDGLTREAVFHARTRLHPGAAYRRPRHGYPAAQHQRNTLRYRLERIGELSGLDLNRLDQRLQLSLGLGLLEPDASV